MSLLVWLTPLFFVIPNRFSGEESAFREFLRSLLVDLRQRALFCISCACMWKFWRQIHYSQSPRDLLKREKPCNTRLSEISGPRRFA